MNLRRMLLLVDHLMARYLRRSVFWPVGTLWLIFMRMDMLYTFGFTVWVEKNTWNAFPSLARDWYASETTHPITSQDTTNLWPRNFCGMPRKPGSAGWWRRKASALTWQYRSGWPRSGVRVPVRRSKWQQHYRKSTGIRHWVQSLDVVWTPIFCKLIIFYHVNPAKNNIPNTSNSLSFQAKFVDEMQRIITSRKKVSIKKDQGWYSEAEMKQDLKWSSILSWSKLETIFVGSSH